MFSKFFIERPIFANVIAIVTVLIGFVALWGLPVEQYPSITPPTVQLSATYPGADAEVVANTVAAPIEQQVNGVENMLYMSSTSSGNGTYQLTVTFEIGTDLDQAQVLTQNRVAIAEPQLPEEVRRQGVTIKKQSTNIILVIALTSPDQRYDTLFLSNYATLRLKDALSRVEGVGEVTIFGASDYSMRVWLNPEQLEARGLTTEDVVAALREQNVQVAAGQIGQPPAPSGLDFQYTVTTQGRLSEAEQFGNIVVKTGEDGRLTYLKDVARVELGSQSYDRFSSMAGEPNASIGIFQLPGANALEVAENVRKTIEQLSQSFPEGMDYRIPFDTTLFVAASVHSVYKTLIEAGVLVLIVILVFLQDWRAVLIPATTVPVTIIGAFAAMAALGFSVNMLTLLGVVLAIGIVVDDAIVIVENAAHHIERGEPPKQATTRAMGEVLGPIIGITLVLMAVFVPSAFLGGITGQFYRQFALTIAATALISAVNAVTLKPAQCALWLRPHKEKKNIFARGFNAVYGLTERIYTAIVRVLVRQKLAMMTAFVALVALAGWWYNRVPTGLLPTEDMGYAMVGVELPDAASQDRTKDVMKRVDAILAETDGVQDWFTIGGMSFLGAGNGPNVGTLFVIFEPWEDRLERGLPGDVMMQKLRAGLAPIQEAIVFAVSPPAIRGLGRRGGFEMLVEDRGGVGLEALEQVTQEVIADASTQSSLASMNTSFRSGVPQLYLDIDREQAKAMNVPLSSVFNTLQASLGSVYVNDFNKFGRTYQVRVQAQQRYRAEPEDIERLEVRTRDGGMVPLGSLVDVQRSFGPQNIDRYNLYPAATITGEPAPGRSSGEAMELMEEIAVSNLPDTMGYEWTGMAYQEKQIGGEAVLVFGMAVLLVYLVLAAQYESWFLPISVILVVPLGLLGSIAAVSLRGMESNIYTQVGIVLIIALASKNAILIVEFARDLRNAGKSILEAAIEAARMRFRPILMTSFAFILGVTPLVFAKGAGAGGQQALGTAVFGGMIASTVLAVFFVPVFYVVFQNLGEWWTGRKRPAAEPSPAVPATDHAKRNGHNGDHHGKPAAVEPESTDDTSDDLVEVEGHGTVPGNGTGNGTKPTHGTKPVPQTTGAKK